MHAPQLAAAISGTTTHNPDYLRDVGQGCLNIGNVLQIIQRLFTMLTANLFGFAST